MNFVNALNAVGWPVWLMIALLVLGPKIMAYSSPKGQLPLRLVPALNEVHNNVIAMVILAAGFALALAGHQSEGFVVLGTRLLTLSPNGNGNGNGKPAPSASSTPTQP